MKRGLVLVTAFCTGAIAMANPLALPDNVMRQKVTPEWAKEAGITVQTSQLADGTIGFTFTRYLFRAPQFTPNSTLMIARQAPLEIRNRAGALLAKTNVSGEARESAVATDNTIVYSFSLARECIGHSRFTLNEYDDYKDPQRQGTYKGSRWAYDVNLSDFITFSRTAPPEHP